MKAVILHNATIVTSAKENIGTVIVSGGKIADVIYKENEDDYESDVAGAISIYEETDILELDGLYLMAGGIDAHVHFRDPGLTHKADISSESLAAAAGGITSVIDMPNTSPATTDAEKLKEKAESAGGRSYVNIGFHIGATNGNEAHIKEMLEGDTEIDPELVGGVKVFMGSSTGNMLVDDDKAIDSFFSISGRPVLVHCEDESTIRENLEAAVNEYGDDIPFSRHEHIRSRKACIRSGIKALEKAMKNGTRLVFCHISTKEELEMTRAAKEINPLITAETSCNYLWFSNEDYDRLGSHVKCNPSIKTGMDRAALREGLANGLIDTIGSDHAPHLLGEKDAPYTKSPSGMPSVQFSLPVLVTIAEQDGIPMTRIASVFSEKASEIYGLNRGRIKKGYAADIVVFDRDEEFTVSREDVLSKCGWSPYEGEILKGKVKTVLVNGEFVFRDGKRTGTACGQLLRFKASR